MDNVYKTRKEAADILGITFPTLYKLAENNEIETVKIGSVQKYNIEKYMRKIKMDNPNKRNICYCRVSSKKQRGDLERQEQYMEKRYPNYEIVSDIGSGLNYNRTGLNRIIRLAINGEINELVVAYKDRLMRFGYELVENLIKNYSNGKIVVINKEEEETPINEITKDIISIMNVYVAKVNGLRKYKKKITKKLKKYDPTMELSEDEKEE